MSDTSLVSASPRSSSYLESFGSFISLEPSQHGPNRRVCCWNLELANAHPEHVPPQWRWRNDALRNARRLGQAAGPQRCRDASQPDTGRGEGDGQETDRNGGKPDQPRGG